MLDILLVDWHTLYMDTMTVAKTILEQLGGRRFAAMTGASHFVGDSNSLQFKLPRMAGSKINLVKITLEQSDLYRVTFYSYRGLTATVLSESAGVYAEDLQRTFTSATGLDTSM